MSNTSTHTQSTGLGFTSVLTIVFIVLKLTHVIDWPWLWVLSPLWLSLAFGILVFALAVGLLCLVQSRRKW